MVRGNTRGSARGAPNGAARTVTPAPAAPPAGSAQPTTLSARFAQLRQDGAAARQQADRHAAVMARRQGAAPVTPQQRQEIVRGALAQRARGRGAPARGTPPARGAQIQRGFVAKRGSAARGVVFPQRGTRGARGGTTAGAAARGGARGAQRGAAADPVRGRGRGARRGGRGGRGRGGGPLSKEDLDKDLDSYMLKDASVAASRLDAELDDYMAAVERGE